MTSEMAKSDIEQLWADGLHPSVQDIVRLNELALRFEREKGKSPTFTTYLLPRVATIDKGVYFRQPTIGHEIWIDSMQRYVEPKDYSTKFALTAFALSKDVEELPDPNDFANIEKCVKEFQEKMKKYTIEQIEAALNYCENGCKSSYGEYPDSNSNEDEDDDFDFDFCVAAGVLHDGVVCQLGITVGEMKKMSREHLNDILKFARMEKRLCSSMVDFKSIGQYELGEYYHTLDNMRERLVKEKKVKEVK